MPPPSQKLAWIWGKLFTLQVTTIGHLSTPHLPVGVAIQPGQVNPSLVPPLVPTSIAGSTLSTFVVPTYAMPTPSTSVATAMPSAPMVADTRPTYVSLGVPLTSAPPLVSATAVPSVVTTASAPPPPLPPVSQDSGAGGPPPPLGTVSCCRSTRTYSDNQATGTCPPIYWTVIL